MSGFNNPVVGALKLIRRAIQSPNYQAGAEGWTVNDDGSAEFNDVTVRGEVDVVGTDGSRVKVDSNAGQAEIELTPPTQPGATFDPAVIGTGSDDASAYLLLTSPREVGSGDAKAQIQLEGSDGSDPNSNAWILADKTTLVGDLEVQGVINPLFGLANVAVGSVNITPSAAGVPTSRTVTFGPLEGSTFFGFVSAATTVPGDRSPTGNAGVTGVGITSVTATSAIVWVNRQNTTSTTVNYLIWGV